MRPLRYLVVDDREEIVELISDVIRLAEPSARINTAYDGIEAIARACNCLPDIVVLDIMMPKMNGYQVCRLIKSDSRFKTTKILFLTGKSLNVDRYRGIKTGAELFVTKPFILEELLEFIRRLREMVIKDPAFDPSEDPRRPLRPAESDFSPDLSGILTKVNDLLDRKVYEMTVINDLISSVRSDFSEEKTKGIFLTGLMNLFGLTTLVFCEPYRSGRKGTLARFVARGSDVMSGSQSVMMESPFPFRMFDDRKTVCFEPEDEKIPAGSHITTRPPLFRQIVERFGLDAQIAVSVKSRDKTMGILVFGITPELPNFEELDESMELFTDQFGMVLDNMRLYRELEKKVDHLARANVELSKIRGNLIRSEKIAAVAKLATGVAHEINNPLGVISACAQTMLDTGSNLPAETIEDLTLIKAETLRAASIVRTLLNFSRQIPLTLQSMELVSWINEILNRGLPGNSMQEIEVVRNIIPGRVRIDARDELLRTITVNLFSNACQAIRESGRKDGRIEVSLWPTSGRKKVKLSISDNGIGIPSVNILKIFDPFFTTKAIGEGVGLGLTLVYTAVKNLGGEIKVESQPGEWTRFDITIPASCIEGVTNERKRGGKASRR